MFGLSFSYTVNHFMSIKLQPPDEELLGMGILIFWCYIEPVYVTFKLIPDTHWTYATKLCYESNLVI